MDFMIFQIEGDHSKDVDSNNAARKQFDDRELEIQVSFGRDLGLDSLINILNCRPSRKSRQT